MSTSIRLLLAEDSEDDAALILRELTRAGYELTHSRVDNAADLTRTLERETWDVMISDYNMPGFGGLEALQIARGASRDLPFIFVSGSIGEDTAVSAMRAGAQDYVMKNNLPRLAPAIARELQEARDRKRLEAQFLQAQKMESVGQLAGGIAHDFNNLLTVISSYAEFLLGDLDAGDSRREDVVQIQEAANQAAQLSRNLLVFSRGEVLRPQVVSIDAVAADAVKLLRRIIGDGIEIVVNLNAPNAQVEVDPSLVTQAVINLAINARDAMPDGGKLVIETRVESGPPARVALAVSYNGHGMDAATQAKIFEPFFTTKPAGKGTGLGLSQVYTVVQQYRGTIHVYSEPGVGTTFRMELPCGLVDETIERIPEPAPAAAVAGETILIVEDAAAVRNVARQILERLGYAVIEAPDGHTALHAAARHHGAIDLLLTDVVMPVMSGRDLADQFRRLRPETRVLFASGYSDEAIVQIGVLDAGTHYLHKPFTPESLARKVRAAIDADGAAKPGRVTTGSSTA